MRCASAPKPAVYSESCGYLVCCVTPGQTELDAAQRGDLVGRDLK